MTSSRFKSKQRGSVLLTTLIFGAVMVVGLAGYLAVAKNSMSLSNRSFNLSLATSIAESGMEAGLYSLNNSNWNAWTVSGSKRSILLTDYLNQAKSGYTDSAFIDLNRNVRANAKIVVYNATSSNPFIVVKSWVWNQAGSNKNPVEKWVKLELGSRSLFARGLVAKNGLQFKGSNPLVDGYDSTLGAYGPGNKLDKGSIGSLSVEVDTISLINAKIWGSASVGSSVAEDGIKVGPHGSVGPYGTAAGTLHNGSIAGDFRAELPAITAPSTFGSTPVPSGSNPVLVGSNDPNNPKLFSAGSLNYTGNNSGLSVTGHVVLVVDGLKATGNNGSVNVAVNSSLKLYSKGPITIAGNGILNATNNPLATQIYTVDTAAATAGDISIKGNGTLTAVVYAPNSDITINGNGDTYGAIIGNHITMTGNGAFHYDVSLAKFNDDQPLTLIRWLELSSISDKQTYAGDF